MSRSVREAGTGETLHTLFRHYPIRFPLILASVGAISFVLQQLSGIWSMWFSILAVFMIVLGLVFLPVGVFVSLRRRRNRVVLRCPGCGASGADVPFRIDYPPGVGYAYVVCSRCGSDFTVDRFARIA